MFVSIVQYLNVPNNCTSHLTIIARPYIFKVFVWPRQRHTYTCESYNELSLIKNKFTDILKYEEDLKYEDDFKYEDNLKYTKLGQIF